MLIINCPLVHLRVLIIRISNFSLLSDSQKPHPVRVVQLLSCPEQEARVLCREEGSRLKSGVEVSPCSPNTGMPGDLALNICALLRRSVFNSTTTKQGSE